MAAAGASATASHSVLGDEPLFAFGRERRVHARAYDYWVSLLHGRRMPCIAEIDPDELSDYSDRSVMIDVSAGGARPAIAFLGSQIRDEAGIAPARPTLEEIPNDTLLSALVAHFADIVAYRAPVGFEAEFAGRHGGRVLHRGILLPFADEDGMLASVLGVITWKELAAAQPGSDLRAAIGSALASRPMLAPASVWGDGPGAAGVMPAALPPQPLDQRLDAARTWAALAASDRTRSEASLHAALGGAYDYFLEARDAQALTARKVIGLVFGTTLGRLNRIRYAAVLNHACRLGLGAGRLPAWLDQYRGGHAAAAIAERAVRRAERQQEEAGGRIAWADAQPPIGHIELSPVNDEFLLLIGRRAPRGVDVIATVPADDLFTGAALARARAG